MLAIIGGSQAYTLMNSGDIAGEYLGAVSTPFGDSQPVLLIRYGDQEMLFLSRHGEEHYSIAAPWVNYRANIWGLKELGATQIVAWSGPGAMDISMNIGQFVLPDDLLDETKSRASSFFEGTGWGFVRQNPVFCPALRDRLHRTLAHLSIQTRTEGVYVCTEGPRLETPSEIRKFRMFGGSLVGMTLVPEVFLAHELEMCYAPVCYVTNYAEGLRERPFVPGVLFEGLLDEKEGKAVEAAVQQFPGILAELSRMPEAETGCHCQESMARYKARGDISDDWHTWVRAARDAGL